MDRALLLNATMTIGDAQQARRRELGRRLLVLKDALARALDVHDRTKSDGALDDAREALDGALREMHHTLAALRALRDSLRPHDDRDRRSARDDARDGDGRASRKSLIW